jgi:TM2 domain-containing membrane protein YozV
MRQHYKSQSGDLPKCGVRQRNAPNIFDEQGDKNRIAAALFAILLGGFGVHKFYLGKIAQGVVYLIFFWLLIPCIIGLIEGIVYLSMSDMEFNRKYNNG